MIVLAIDTCDSRGSVAVLRDQADLKLVSHESQEDYSSWLLPAVSEALSASGLKIKDVEAYAVAAGPGSFTGVRIGLTTVKAWAEVYGKRIVALSRLEAVAGEASRGTPWVASFVNAQREQVFGAVFRRDGTQLTRVGDEMVIAPGKFIETAVELANGAGIGWVSPDAECATSQVAWKPRAASGESVESVPSVLAPMIGRIGLQELAAGRFTDGLALDANYVRRSDAEIFWKAGVGSR